MSNFKHYLRPGEDGPALQRIMETEGVTLPVARNLYKMRQLGMAVASAPNRLPPPERGALAGKGPQRGTVADSSVASELGARTSSRQDARGDRDQDVDADRHHSRNSPRGSRDWSGGNWPRRDRREQDDDRSRGYHRDRELSIESREKCDRHDRYDWERHSARNQQSSSRDDADYGRDRRTEDQDGDRSSRDALRERRGDSNEVGDRHGVLAREVGRGDGEYERSTDGERSKEPALPFEQIGKRKAGAKPTLTTAFFFEEANPKDDHRRGKETDRERREKLAQRMGLQPLGVVEARETAVDPLQIKRPSKDEETPEPEQMLDRRDDRHERHEDLDDIVARRQLMQAALKAEADRKRLQASEESKQSKRRALLQSAFKDDHDNRSSKKRDRSASPCGDPDVETTNSNSVMSEEQVVALMRKHKNSEGSIRGSTRAQLRIQKESEEWERAKQNNPEYWKAPKFARVLASERARPKR